MGPILNCRTPYPLCISVKVETQLSKSSPGKVINREIRSHPVFEEKKNTNKINETHLLKT